MKVLFLDAPYDQKVVLSAEVFESLQKNNFKVVGIYASVQFVHLIEEVRRQLQEWGIEALTSKPDRAHKQAQILGCNIDGLNLSEGNNSKIQAYLYIGDGKFHPLALLYGQRTFSKDDFKPVLCFDPITKNIGVLTFEEVKKILKRYKASMMKFINSKKIGVIITLKPGQEHHRAARLLEKKYHNKKFYYFVDDKISFEQLENFPFIDLWINTACPRIGLDDNLSFRKGVININDALRAEELLSSANLFTLSD